MTVNILIAHGKERRLLPLSAIKWNVFDLSQGVVSLLAFVGSGLEMKLCPSSIQWGIKGRLMVKRLPGKNFAPLYKSFWDEKSCPFPPALTKVKGILMVEAALKDLTIMVGKSVVIRDWKVWSERLTNSNYWLLEVKRSLIYFCSGIVKKKHCTCSSGKFSFLQGVCGWFRNIRSWT